MPLILFYSSSCHSFPRQPLTPDLNLFPLPLAPKVTITLEARNKTWCSKNKEKQMTQR